MNDNVLNHISIIAQSYSIEKLILFGSRARKDHTERSDYDIAVFAPQLSHRDKVKFNFEVEDIPTLHKIDIVYMDSYMSDVLRQNIEKEGIVLHEQIFK
jgi:predicted nucleotidyltransferase